LAKVRRDVFPEVKYKGPPEERGRPARERTLPFFPSVRSQLLFSPLSHLFFPAAFQEQLAGF